MTPATGTPRLSEERVDRNLARLREFASKASTGPWHASIGKVGVGALGAERPSLLLAGIRTFDGRDEIFAESNADAAYIAAANPETVLALLTERAGLLTASELGTAWQRAEAALPEGWRVSRVEWDLDDEDYEASAATVDAIPRLMAAGITDKGRVTISSEVATRWESDNNASAHGPTPALALQALAAKLEAGNTDASKGAGE